MSATKAGAIGDGRTNDTRALQAVLAKHRGLHIPPGRTFASDQLTLRPGNFIFGAGTLLQNDPKAPLLYANSGAADRTVDGLSFTGVQLRGKVEELGFSEWHHLASLHGVRNVSFDQVTFYGFRGDGLYLGSGPSGGEERHNFNVRVTGCTFDGANRDNRNGISAIDIDGLEVTGSTFRRCTRRNMPGPIDLEPDDQPWHVIRNVTIRGNRFEENGGGVGEVSIVLQPSVRDVPTNIVVEDNVSIGYRGRGKFYTYVSRRAPGGLDPLKQVREQNNRVQR